MSDIVERAKAALEGVPDGPWTVEREDGEPMSLVPELVAEVERLRARETKLRELANHWMSNYGPGSRKYNVFGEQVVTVEFAVETILAVLDGEGRL